MYIENRVELTIVSDHIGPESISRSIGMEPDFQLVQGSRDPEGPIPRFNIWRLKANGTKWDSLPELMAMLIERVTPETAERIKNIVDQEHTMVTVEFLRDFKDGQLEPNNTSPLFDISVTNFLASIGAQFGFAETFDETLEPNTYGPWMPDVM